MRIALRRYTNLAATLHLLSTRRITLLDPSDWPDKNDSFFMSEYKRLLGAESALALCLTEASETFHHWRIYSNGTDGVCIEFDKQAILQAFGGDARIQHKRVRYTPMKEIEALTQSIGLTELPFLKRWPYRDEKEYRVVFTDTQQRHMLADYPFDLNSIRRITLSPWMPAGPAASVKEIIKQIPGCSGLAVYRSRLVQTEAWKKLASKLSAAPIEAI